MEKTTVRAQLVAYNRDACNYTTYVFKLLDKEAKVRLDDEYLMCVRYPNWECPEIKLFDIGYVQVMEVLAGIDKYFNKQEFIPYNYDNIQFIKFVTEPKRILDGTVIID